LIAQQSKLLVDNYFKYSKLTHCCGALLGINEDYVERDNSGQEATVKWNTVPIFRANMFNGEFT